MNELRPSPAFNDFVKNQMISDARDILDHVNGALDKWNLLQYKLTGETIPFVVDAVRSFVDSMHDLTSDNKFITEYGPIDNLLIDRRNVSDITMKHFLCTELRDKFMQFAPPGVFEEKPFQLRPVVKIIALQLLDKTMQRQLGVIGGFDQDYKDIFYQKQADTSYATAYSFVYVIGQLFSRVEHQKGITLGAQYLNNLARDFYVEDIPKSIDAPITIADHILVELNDRMKIICKATTPKPANDFN